METLRDSKKENNLIKKPIALDVLAAKKWSKTFFMEVDKIIELLDSNLKINSITNWKIKQVMKLLSPDGYSDDLNKLKEALSLSERKRDAAFKLYITKTFGTIKDNMKASVELLKTELAWRMARTMHQQKKSTNYNKRLKFVNIQEVEYTNLFLNQYVQPKWEFEGQISSKWEETLKLVKTQFCNDVAVLEFIQHNPLIVADIDIETGNESFIEDRADDINWLIHDKKQQIKIFNKFLVNPSAKSQERDFFSSNVTFARIDFWKELIQLDQSPKGQKLTSDLKSNARQGDEPIDKVPNVTEEELTRLDMNLSLSDLLMKRNPNIESARKELLQHYYRRNSEALRKDYALFEKLKSIFDYYFPRTRVDYYKELSNIIAQVPIKSASIWKLYYLMFSKSMSEMTLSFEVLAKDV